MAMRRAGAPDSDRHTMQAALRRRRFRENGDVSSLYSTAIVAAEHIRDSMSLSGAVMLCVAQYRIKLNCL